MQAFSQTLLCSGMSLTTTDVYTCTIESISSTIFCSLVKEFLYRVLKMIKSNSIFVTAISYRKHAFVTGMKTG